MDDMEEEIDEDSFEEEDTELSDDAEVTPEEEAFLQGYNEADSIAKDEKESADTEDETGA